MAATAIVALAGIDAHIGGLSIRAHSATRVLIVVAMLVAARIWTGIVNPAVWITRVALLTAISGSVMTWLRFLLTAIGGADSYGYGSAARLIASGRLIDTVPIAEWLSAANRMAIASPLGWAPSADGSGIVPTYPLGVSYVMAAFDSIGGPHAIFLVSPVMALVALVLVYRFACDWFDREIALFAVVVAAWNPIFIAYAKQPMSDMAATMWIMLAVLLALRSNVASGFFAGAAAGAAVITRPALLVAAAITPLGAYRGKSSLQRAAVCVAGLGLGVMIQMALQRRMFGSPFASGYGTAGAVFATTHFATNLDIFVRQGWVALGPIWVAGLVAGIGITDMELRWHLALLAITVTAPYLFWLPFDHWETLRFLLPALLPLSVVVAAGFVRIARSIGKPVLTAIVLLAIVIPLIGRSEALLRASSAWEISMLEERYPLAGEWLNVNTPPGSVALANQHSGSLRWYGNRQTLRWDFIDPAQLVTTVRELQSHGAAVYVVLEGTEVAMFDERFKDVIGRLQVDHVGHIRNVNFRRLAYLPPNR